MKGDMKKKVKNIYENIKKQLIDKGYQKEIGWCANIPPLDKLDKMYFFNEYCWVVINTGMKNQVAEKIFNNFWGDYLGTGTFNFEAIKHPQKHLAIKKIYDRLDFYFDQLKKSKNKLLFLKSLPFIGDITKYHLARNLGLDYAKPDRHLVRISNLFEYDNVQTFCKEVADISGDKIGVVDIVFWRFATLTDQYLELIKREGLCDEEIKKDT